MFSNLFRRSKTKTNLQGKSNGRNVAALLALKDLEYPLKNIRKALVVLNGIALKDIAGDQVSVPSVSNTINAARGKRGNTEAKQLISEKLGVQVADLFDQPSA